MSHMPTVLSLFSPCYWSIWSSKSLYLRKKSLNKVMTSVNLEGLNVDFVLQHFKMCLFVNEGDEETNS